MEIVFLIIGALLGFIIAYLWMKSGNIPKAKIADSYVDKSLYNNLESTKEKLEQNLVNERNKAFQLSNNNVALSKDIDHLQKRLIEQKAELGDFHKKFESEFQVLANKMLEDKSAKFVDINKEHLGRIIDPLKEKISAFEKQVGEAFEKEKLEKNSLKIELQRIVEMNQQMSKEAMRLTNALKGDNKVQGDWGEMQLESILEHAGLQKGIHYEAQNSFNKENGGQLRPDYLIKLPQNKNIILDAKVSLSAYERYYNCKEDSDKAQHLKDHILSMQNHIKNLSSKNYPDIAVDTPDYVLLFVPLEAALQLALQENHALHEQALKANIVLVSTTTLLATLRMVAFLWTQENQQKNALEISRNAGKLYDKFVAFTEDLKDIGSKLDAASNSYHSAFNKLSESSKKGDTIVGRITKLKELGAASTKNLELSEHL